MALGNQEIFKAFLIRQALVNRYIRRSQQEFRKGLELADRELVEIAIKAVEDIGNKSMVTRTGHKALEGVEEALIKSRRGALEPIVKEFLAELRQLVADQFEFNKGIAEDTEVGQENGVEDPDSDDDLGLYPMDGRTLDEWWAVFFAGDSARIMGELKSGLVAGETETEILSRLRGTSEGGFTDGATRTSYNSLESLAPTLVTGAMAFANYSFSQANGDLIRKERYTAILDSRTSVFCAAHDGILYNVGEGPAVPAHRNCRSQRVPVYVGAGETVDKDLSYEEWLKGQPVDVQNTVLGTAKARVFREGGLSIADMLRKNGTPMTIAELVSSSAKARKILT